MKDRIESFLEQQLEQWQMAKENYDALNTVETKFFMVKGYGYSVQFNPSRIISSNAKVDKESIEKRRCFLCSKNQPKEQMSLPYNEDFRILINPFPIFKQHLTIPLIEHKPQEIEKYFSTLLDLTAYNEKYLYFYNGPKCGASAPDHMHFQAGNRGMLPIEKDWEKYPKETIAMDGAAQLIGLRDDLRHPFIIESATKTDAIHLFKKIYNVLKQSESDKEEPMLNIIAWKNEEKYIISLFSRRAHRPSCYYKENKEENLLISPASVDMGGLFILPQKKDFQKITLQHITAILKEVSLSESDYKRLTLEILKQI